MDCPVCQKRSLNLSLEQLETPLLVQFLQHATFAVYPAFSKLRPGLTAAVDLLAAKLGQGGRLIYFGAGTSGRIGFLDAADCYATFGCPPEQVIASVAGGLEARPGVAEGAEDHLEQGEKDLEALKVTANDVVCFLSDSGTTPYILGGLRSLKRAGQGTSFLITGNGSAESVREVDLPLVYSVGEEIIFGSTRLNAATLQKMVANLLSTAAMIRLGKVMGRWMVDLQVKNKKLRQRACEMIAEIGAVSLETAEATLQQAHDSVKCALAMIRMNLPFEEAQRRLQECQGNLAMIH